MVRVSALVELNLRVSRGLEAENLTTDELRRISSRVHFTPGPLEANRSFDLRPSVNVITRVDTVL